MLQDKTAIIHVLGCLLKNPTLLSETDKYKITNDDFPEKFHKIVFAAINNLYQNGNDVIDEIEVDGFLKNYDIQYEIFTQNNGIEYLQHIRELSKEDNFDYYYQRLKKFSLIREMDSLGFGIKEIYDDSIVNPKEREEMIKRFDRLSVLDILMFYETKMIEVKDKFESNTEAKGIQAGEGIDELLDKLEESPEIGVPLNSEFLTTIFRGSRKKKYYIRSSYSGGGKTRNMIADACRISAIELYDLENKKWVKNDFNERSVVISTEMTFDELQLPCISYISGVEEDKISTNILNREEKERVRYASEILKKSNIWLEHLPDFNVRDIERTIEKNIIKNQVEYVYFDYIHSSVSIFSQYSKQSGIALREDQVLLLMSNKLKDICNKYDVYLMTATQLNGEWKEAWRRGDQIDSTYIRGAKSIIDKADAGMIMLPISKKEKEEIHEILKTGFYSEPNMVIHIFKNRGNRLNNVKVFIDIDLGNMRIKDCFVTNEFNELIKVDKLIVKKKTTDDF